MQGSSQVDASAARNRVFRVFISSPGDVGDERAICARVVDRLRPEFAGAAQLEAVMWEQEPMSADASFQEQIPLPSECDAVVMLLWSRLGHRLHRGFKCPERNDVPTGTLYEFQEALDARRKSPDGVPDLLVYRKTAEPPKPSISDRVASLKALDDWQQVEDFFSSALFRDPEDGSFVGAYHSFRRTAEFGEIFEKHLRALLSRRLGAEARADIDWKQGSPFRGLRAFDFEDAPIFYGRTKAAAEIRDVLRERANLGCPFLLVMGMSGGGKSSLVRAGLLPSLVQPGVIEGVGLWRRVVVRPGDSNGNLLGGLATALLQGDREAGVGLVELTDDPRDATALAANLRAGSEVAGLILQTGLRQAAQHSRNATRELLLQQKAECEQQGDRAALSSIEESLTKLRAPVARLVLVLDQFEEIFTDTRITPDERDKFIDVIGAWARSGQAWVVATLRSDLFAQCEELPALVELKQGNGTYHLLAPTGPELAQMIRQPATAAGLTFGRDPKTGETLDEILLTAASGSGALPLLQFTLDELYKIAVADNRRVLERADYDALGGLEGAIATRAEEVFNEIRERNAAAAAALPAVFAALTRIAPADDDSDAPVVSQTARHSQFAEVPGAIALIDALVEARLLVSDRGEVRVAHEALLRFWGRAKDWVAQNQEFLRAKTRVAEAAARWRAEAKSCDYLLSKGKPLVESEDLLAHRRGELSADEIQFIEQSSEAHRQAERAEARRRHLVLATISAAGIAALILAVISFWQFGKARSAAARAAHARAEAEKLIDFMGVDLRNKLEPIGRLELLDAANQRVRAYYNSFTDSGEQDASILARQSTAFLNEGDILHVRSDQAGALQLYQKALDVRRKLLQQRPNDPGLRADLATSLDRIGNALRSQGRLDDANAAYKEALDLRAALAANVAPDSPARRDLATSWLNVGDVAVFKGDLPQALESYQKSRTIDEAAVRQTPGDSSWQHDLYTAEMCVGDVLRSRNDLSGALAAFNRGLTILQQLLEGDPRNAGWQRDIAVARERVADAFQAKGDPAGALREYRAAVDIHQRLATQDPSNAMWQRDLINSHLQLGDTLLAQDQGGPATTEFQEAARLQQALIDRDPSSVQWQRGLALADERLAGALKSDKKVAPALEKLNAALTIRRRLAEHDASNSESLRDVAVTLIGIGDVHLLDRKLGEARASYEQALDIERPLAQRDASNADWQRDRAEVQDKLGQVAELSGRLEEAVTLYREAFKLYGGMSDQNPTDVSLGVASARSALHLALALKKTQGAEPEVRVAMERAQTLSARLLAQRVALAKEDRNVLEQVSRALRQVPP